MKLGFEESQTSYATDSQSARAWTLPVLSVLTRNAFSASWAAAFRAASLNFCTWDFFSHA
jgi:hypothetical protein